jgi:hypothetical protein
MTASTKERKILTSSGSTGSENTPYESFLNKRENSELNLNLKKEKKIKRKEKKAKGTELKRKMHLLLKPIKDENQQLFVRQRCSGPRL